MKEKRLIAEGKDIYHVGIWLRNTVWDLRDKGELPVVVEIEIRKDQRLETRRLETEDRSKSTEQTEQTETTEQTE